MMAQTSLGYAGAADPAGGNALIVAANWVQSLLLGSLASAIAIIAIAVIGVMMFSGRIDIRRGVTVIAGCFLLFGAPAISAGLQGALAGNPEAPTTFTAPPAVVIPPSTLPTPSRTPSAYDPYAGASLPSGN